MILRANVKPNSHEFIVKLNGDKLEIDCTQRPERGAVNREILVELSQLLKTQVRIIKGLKSRNKIIEINCDEKKIGEKIKRFC